MSVIVGRSNAQNQLETGGAAVEDTAMAAPDRLTRRIAAVGSGAAVQEADLERRCYGHPWGAIRAAQRG